jgi:aminopeptidase N
MKIHNVLLIVLNLLIWSGCATNNTNKKALSELDALFASEPITVLNKHKRWVPTANIEHEMKHLRLEISFDYQNQTAKGKATITLKPYFYESQLVVLDAKMMKLHRVAKLESTDTIPLKFEYDSSLLKIDLGRKYNRSETYQLFVQYTAQPELVIANSKTAITDAKGLYFINPLGVKPQVPTQIWTQGEPESNSVWIPMIDKPNQKYTQEFFITVKSEYVTLSNGELMWSKEHDDNTRTDYWKQQLPHAPYLSMICVGDFKITKDYWRDSVEVNYYLEPDYAPYAMQIFGKTPQMMECFSQKLGVDYPWEKYSQVVVREFVSGAMENTTAVIHYDGVQRTPRELIDYPQDGIIAHELFHQWFGDLVTCESWNNLSLNESFATYGEYLWYECGYGRDIADEKFIPNLSSYLASRNKHDEPLFRNFYHTPNDVFDVVSYQKGSRVLHMLRNYIGDEAFFKSIQLYLTRFAFKSAEVHNFRLIVEEVTGKDMNWFFNQWFFNAGHPYVEVKYKLSDSKKKVDIQILQQQDTLQYGVFYLPLNIEVYDDKNNITTHPYFITQADQMITIAIDHPIANVNINPGYVLLADIEDRKSTQWWNKQALKAPHMIDRNVAVTALEAQSDDTQVAMYLKNIQDVYLKSTSELEREMGASLLYNADSATIISYKDVLVKMVADEKNSINKIVALMALAKLNQTETNNLIADRAQNDSSYVVNRYALLTLFEIDTSKALAIAKLHEDDNMRDLVVAVSEIYSQQNDSTYLSYFMSRINPEFKYRDIIIRHLFNYLNTQPFAIQRLAYQKIKEQRLLDNQFKQLADYYVNDKIAYLNSEKMSLEQQYKKQKTAIAKAEVQEQIIQIDELITILSR